MKNWILTGWASLCCLTVWGQTPARLSGTVKGFTGKPVLVCSFMDNERNGLDTLSLAEDGSFRTEYVMNKPVEAMLHVKGDETDASFCLYFSPGASLRVDVERGGSGVFPRYTGDTGYRSEYKNLRREMYTLSPTFSEKTWLELADFNACRRYIADRHGVMEAVLAKIPDSSFVAGAKSVLAEEIPGFCFDYAIAKEKSGVKMEQDTDFMTFVKQVDVNDTAQVGIISKYIDWYMTAHPDMYDDVQGEAAKLRCVKAVVTNQDVRNRLAESSLSLIAMARMFGMDVSEFAPSVYREILALSTDRKMCEPIRKELRAMEYRKVGAEAAADIRMEDASGKVVSLRDVVGRGRYTYIDFWATWCGPCCREIPFLEKLSDKYANNKNIRFVSISLDKDKEAWLKKLEADNPSWEQYNIPEAWQGACSDAYDITGIPRFMLFDKEGRLLDVSASRPSEPKTAERLETLAAE